MIFSPATAQEIHDAYHVRGLSLLRLAKIMDCRVSEIREAIAAVEAQPRIPRKEYAEHAYANLLLKSRDLPDKRRGKRRRVAHVQRPHLARGKAVSLPSLSFMGKAP